MQYTTYANDREFSAGLGQLTTSAKKIDALCHSLIIGALALAAPGNGGDRNVDRLRRVFERFPKGSRLKAAMHAAKEYAPVTIQIRKKDGQLVVKLRKDAPGDWTVNPDPAQHTPFWDMTAEKDPAPFKPVAALKAFIRKGQNGLAGKVRMEVPDGMQEESIARILAATEAALKAEEEAITA